MKSIEQKAAHVRYEQKRNKQPLPEGVVQRKTPIKRKFGEKMSKIRRSLLEELNKCVESNLEIETRTKFGDYLLRYPYLKSEIGVNIDSFIFNFN